MTMELSAKIKEKSYDWASNLAFDEETRKEISQLISNQEEKELVERFHQELSFGTGGLRGLVGSGCSRVNKYTIRKATTALCLYLKKTYGESKNLKVAISFDSRLTSQFFSEIASEVLTYHGIKVFLTKELRPTPLLSFMVRHFSCHAGICITASHNPSTYNGYKVYWGDGSQIVRPHDEGIINEYNGIENYNSLAFLDFKKALSQGLVNYYDEELDKAYLAELKKVSYQSNLKKTEAIVYTPLHGAGVSSVPHALSQGGFKNIFMVPEQEKPDGSFPTVGSPNPEDPKTLVLAKKLADKVKSDLVLATDPDADRIAVSFREKDGKWSDLNGHQMASLLTFYILSSLKQEKKLPEKPYLVKTIVTTDLIKSLAKHYSCECYETLTGFKWIADVIAEKEKSGASFICGGEESFGFLAKSFVRDKDAVSTAYILCEMFSYYKSQGKNFTEVLDGVYREHGVYCESLNSIELPGKDGLDKIKYLMKFFREEQGEGLFDKNLEGVTDYEEQVKTCLVSGKKEKRDDFPRSNVLSFDFSENFRLVVRPSGTEAKIKFYFFHKSSLATEGGFCSVKNLAQKGLDEFKEKFLSKLKTII